MRTLSQKAFDKLYLFCSWANKSTGTDHPLDEIRWFDFICQTVDESKIINTSTLADILQDEEYLGKGNTWNEYWAQKLATQYETACRLLQYYKQK